MSPLSCVFLGGSIITFGDSGRLRPECCACESAQPGVLSSLCLDPTLSKYCLTATQMLLNFLLPVQLPDAFALRLSFFHFRGLTHAVEDADRVLVAASLDVILVFVDVVLVVVVVVVVVVAVNVILVLVVVAAVNVILFVDDDVQFPHAPALTPNAALAVISLRLS